MVNDFNLHKIESISEDLLEMTQVFDKSLSHIDIKERFKIRAKSAFYQTLSSLMTEVTSFKQYTTINSSQLKDLKRKINNLLRLADETGIDKSNEKLLNRIQVNSNFQF
ncbi:hypothetical protein [Euzebyella saccharophila]|uniref:Uncharacterized protein n=1 Tax=Euzebyella saccharophila TaxID=679664 RepID=A0ABV8JUB2_9FLAO|nr:hypothetical protein [Euzebyella saccharophila]